MTDTMHYKLIPASGGWTYMQRVDTAEEADVSIDTWIDRPMPTGARGQQASLGIGVDHDTKEMKLVAYGIEGHRWMPGPWRVAFIKHALSFDKDYTITETEALGRYLYNDYPVIPASVRPTLVEGD